MSDTVRVSKGKLDELISVARSINRGKAHEIRVPGDDEPCYLQRKEWVDWAVIACEELVEDVARLNGNSNTEPATGQQG